MEAQASITDIFIIKCKNLVQYAQITLKKIDIQIFFQN